MFSLFLARLFLSLSLSLSLSLFPSLSLSLSHPFFSVDTVAMAHVGSLAERGKNGEQGRGREKKRDFFPRWLSRGFDHISSVSGLNDLALFFPST
jgi:hypothetical protein